MRFIPKTAQILEIISKQPQHNSVLAQCANFSVQKMPSLIILSTARQLLLSRQ
jgi:hypothetical protein